MLKQFTLNIGDTYINITMAWRTRTHFNGYTRIAMLVFVIGSCSMDTSFACPNTCECTGTSIACFGYDLPSTVSELPPNTQAFRYVALEEKVDLLGANFEHLTELRELNIGVDEDDLYNVISPIPSSAQSIFTPLTKLQILRINVNWYFEHPLDDLFRPLVHLQELDLSNTRRLNITNLQRAMYGLSNSTKLTIINLSNIQMYEYTTFSTFNLTWFLEPLKKCPLKRLHLAYNAFKAIYPGIIRFTPQLEYIDASHNLIAPLIASAFFIETILHKGLQETDQLSGLSLHRGLYRSRRYRSGR